MKGVIAMLALAACGADDGPAPVCENIADQGAPLGPLGVIVHEGYVYWLTQDPGTLWRESVDGGQPEVVSVIGGFPRAITAGPDGMYIAGGCEGAIWYVPFAGRLPVAIGYASSTDVCVHGIAVGGDRVYFTTGSVNELPMAGGAPTALVPAIPSGGGCLGSIAIGAGQLYWESPCSDVSPDYAALTTMPLDGGTPRVIDPGMLGGDAIAVNGDYVYWATAEPSPRIVRVPTFVGNIEPLADVDGTVFGIAVDASNVYWTTHDAVWKAPLDGSDAVTMLAATTGAAAVAVDDTSVYWAGGDVCPAQHVAK